MIHFDSWNNLREMVDQKREEINLAHGVQNFNIECSETIVSKFDLWYRYYILENWNKFFWRHVHVSEIKTEFQVKVKPIHV